MDEEARLCARRRLRSILLYLLPAVLASGVSSAGVVSGESEYGSVLHIPVVAAPAEMTAEVLLRMSRVDRRSPEVTTVCEVTAGSARCLVPSGHFDIEVRATDAVPMYLWDVEIEPRSEQVLPPFEVEQGSRIEGRVSAEAAPGSVLVLLTPHGAEPPGEAGRRHQFRTRTTTPDAEGTFRFTGLSSGAYDVIATSDGHSPATKPGVHISLSQVVDVGTLSVKPLAALRLYVTPPLDFANAAWKVVLTGPLPNSEYEETVREGEMSLAGFWEARGLAHGPYKVHLLSSSGERVEQKEMLLEGDLTDTIAIHRIFVQGSVTRDDEPVSGVVTLISREGASFLFRTDDDGVFRGTLPGEGAWRAKVAAAGATVLLPDEIHVDAGNDGVAQLTLDLPSGRIRGTVIDGGGEGVPASVVVFRNEKLVATVDSDEAGAFEVDSLEKKEHTLRAFAAEGESETLAVTPEANRVELRVAPRVTVKGVAFDTRGQPVIGGIVRYRGGRPGAAQTTTSLDGSFSFQLSGETRTAGIALLTYGGVLAIFTVAIADEGAKVELRLPARSGVLNVVPAATPPWPFVSRDGVTFFTLPELFLPTSGRPAEVRPGGPGFSLRVEAGTWIACPSPATTNLCRMANVPEGGEVTLELNDRSGGGSRE